MSVHESLLEIDGIWSVLHKGHVIALLSARSRIDAEQQLTEMMLIGAAARYMAQRALPKRKRPQNKTDPYGDD